MYIDSINILKKNIRKNVNSFLNNINLYICIYVYIKKKNAETSSCSKFI